MDRDDDNKKNGFKLISINKNITARIIFTIGPAIEIFPFSSSVIIPVYEPIYTAPGARNINPNKPVIIAMSSPVFHFLNSAKNPYFCATYLCPSSCNIKLSPIVTSEIGIKYIIIPNVPLLYKYANNNVITIIAILKSLVSVFEN